jgi:hypothetical protein
MNPIFFKGEILDEQHLKWMEENIIPKGHPNSSYSTYEMGNEMGRQEERRN